jgi:hypothetical protein
MRLFRNGQAQAGREIDLATTKAKAARTEALRELDEHQVSPVWRLLSRKGHVGFDLTNL